MTLTCTITVKDEPSLVYDAFVAEEKSFKHGRASYSVRKEKGSVIIEARADDPTALRAVVTSVTRILNIVRKTGRVGPDG